MRIAVVGGGFYGCVVALHLSKIDGLDVDLFERRDSLLSGAISANQHRLHLGFHYPRCDATISQAIASYNVFQSHYGNAVEEVRENIYCVHNDSGVSADAYKSKMQQHGLGFDEVSVPPDIVDKDKIPLAIRVAEKMINLSKLASIVRDQIAASQVNVFLGADADPCALMANYDYVINCTYTEPGAGVDLKTKSELAVMLLTEAPLSWSGKGITIMDGPFCSIYPADNGTHTISSVVHTPAIRAASSRMLERIAASLSPADWAEIDSNIFNHASSFVNLDGFKIIGRYVTIKTKLEQDRNDFRGTFVVQKNNVISVMAGKISCAFLVIDDILKKIGV